MTSATPDFQYPPQKGLISLCVVTRNARELLATYIDSVLRSVGDSSRVEIIVVDNDSTDGTRDALMERFPDSVYLLQKPGVGFTRGINKAILASKGEFILIATPSTEVITDAIPQLMDFLVKNPETGVVGPRVVHPDGATQYSSKKMPTPKVAFLHSLHLFGLIKAGDLLNEYFLFNYNSNEPKAVTSLTMSLLLARRKVFEDVGLLDEDLFIWASDVDWCRKVEQSAWKQFFVPNATVIHRRNQVSKKQPIANLFLYHKDLKTFYRKHFAKKNGFIIDLLWNLMLQARLLALIVRYMIVTDDSYSYY